jgi:spermidine/putrescine-binding protein
MGKCSVEFEVVSKFTIDIEVNDDEFTDDVEDDIKTIVADYEDQINDMISGNRKAKLLTQHGYVIKLVNIRDVRLSDAGEETVSSEIDKENFIRLGI